MTERTGLAAILVRSVDQNVELPACLDAVNGRGLGIARDNFPGRHHSKQHA